MFGVAVGSGQAGAAVGAGRSLILMDVGLPQSSNAAVSKVKLSIGYFLVKAATASLSVVTSPVDTPFESFSIVVSAESGSTVVIIELITLVAEYCCVARKSVIHV